MLFDRLSRFPVDFLIEIYCAAFGPDVDANCFQVEPPFGDAGDNMLGGMPACDVQPVPAVNAGNMRSITEGLIESVDYPAFDNLDVKNIAFTNSALVGRLASFIRMKHDGLYSDSTVADRLNFDFDLINIRICPIQSFHNGIITGKRPVAQAPSLSNRKDSRKNLKIRNRPDILLEMRLSSIAQQA